MAASPLEHSNTGTREALDCCAMTSRIAAGGAADCSESRRQHTVQVITHWGRSGVLVANQVIHHHRHQSVAAKLRSGDVPGGYSPASRRATYAGYPGMHWLSSAAWTASRGDPSSSRAALNASVDTFRDCFGTLVFRQFGQRGAVEADATSGGVGSRRTRPGSSARTSNEPDPPSSANERTG